MKILRAVKIDQTVPREQFAEWVDQHGNAVYKLCRTLAFSKEDADDLFQETFLKAYEQLHKLSDSGNPQGFLCSVTIYIWKSWKRKHARRERIAPVMPMNETIAEGLVGNIHSKTFFSCGHRHCRRVRVYYDHRVCSVAALKAG